MSRPGGNTTKIISDDALLFESALKQRALFRLIGGCALAVLAACLVAGSFLPIVAKSTIPLLWIDYANNHGWTKEMQDIGMRLIANGRIEIYPLWVSYTVMTVGMLVGWVAAHIIRNRNETKLLGDLLTKSYWLHFYWLKKPGSCLKVSSRQPSRKA